MSSTRTWLPLPVPSTPGLPVLLISIDIGTAAYTVHVTDMANMWVESLDRKAICIRGWSENTSIDPSDTPENMGKFLTSLRSGLDTSQPGHEETSLELLPGSKSDTGDDGLTLKITCELRGMQPLKWPMHLKKSPPSSIATDLVLPLIQAHLTRSKEVESLIRILGQKDAVVTKLVDKLEAVGTGLEHVFNALPSKKKASRESAEERVPGLAPFNRRRWKSELMDKEDGPSNTEALVNDAFGGEGLQYQSTVGIDTSPGLDRWWCEFSGVSNAAQPRKKVASEKEATPPPQAQSAEQDDDDFQVQSTPPHLKSTRQPTATKEKTIPDDASTEDEDEAPEPESPPPAAAAAETRTRTQAKKPASRLGILGRNKQSTPARPPSPKLISPEKQAAGVTVDDSETASETEEDGVTASSPKKDSPPHPSSPSKSAAKKGGLGRIGGPKPMRTKRDDARPDEKNQPSTSLAPKKLGVLRKKIGGKGQEKGAEGESSRGRSERRGEGDKSRKSEPKETSQERADRKREELKRELEKKAAAGPAKKKRKF